MDIFDCPEVGHTMLARTADGKTHELALSTIRFQHHEAVKAVNSSNGKAIDKGMESLKNITPFAQVAAPLVERARTGLASCGKLVGGSTYIANADSKSVAVLHRIKKSLDEGVVAPLEELAVRTEMRKEVLEEIQQTNMKYRLLLKQSILALQKSVERTCEREKILLQVREEAAERGAQN